MYKPKILFFILLSIPFLAFTWARKLPAKQGVVWETLEWTVNNAEHEGNPFDVEAQVTFTHRKSKESRQIAMFYDENNTWKFRFTPDQPGTWSFTTSSQDKALDGLEGKVNVKANPDPEAHGFMKSFGNKWGWEGTEEAFVPQYVMGKDLEYYYDTDAGKVREDLIEEDIQEFMIEHGFTGFHLNGKAQWFELGAGEDDDVGENPDPRSYEVMETIIRKVHAQGGACHIWMWGADGKNDDKGGPGGIVGGEMSEIDQRNLRYLAARLGPLPSWSMGYGFDTENGWATKEQLNSWKAFLEERTGWVQGWAMTTKASGHWTLCPPNRPWTKKTMRPSVMIL